MMRHLTEQMVCYLRLCVQANLNAKCTAKILVTILYGKDTLLMSGVLSIMTV